jgi:hypothetical protein
VGRCSVGPDEGRARLPVGTIVMRGGGTRPSAVVGTRWLLSWIGPPQGCRTVLERFEGDRGRVAASTPQNTVKMIQNSFDQA